MKRGFRKFGERGKAAAFKEMKQLHDRVVFEPIKYEELTKLEKRRAMESLIFTVEKRDKTVKARTCANGSTQRGYIERDQAASPTASTEAIIIMDVMTSDVPNAFVQTDIDQSGERIIMKIRGALVDMLVEMDPTTYQNHVIERNGEKVLYVRMLKALYGMLTASLLYYKKFKKDIEEIGFQLNPYEPCVANRTIGNKQHTITWHVDDIKSSHIDPKVNDNFHEWLEKTYGEDGIGKVKSTRGKKHEYLAMRFDFNRKGKVGLDMTDYIKQMVNEFPYAITKTMVSWNENLFKVNENESTLNEEKKKVFHTFVMKGMFACKRGRQDIQPGIAFLSTRTTKSNSGDWNKLLKLMGFLSATQDDVMYLEADNWQRIEWFVDAAFAVHYDFKSHTGAICSLGGGSMISTSTKQKVNTRSSTEAELVSLDDVISKFL